MPQAKHAYTTPKLPRALPPSARKQVEKAIEAHSEAREALIAFLDASDADADLEPSLGGQDPAWSNTDQDLWALSNTDDREGDEHDGREVAWIETHGGQCVVTSPSEDDEPSLARTQDIDQTRARANLGAGWITDGEAEHDGREPSLGSLESKVHMQLGWASGARDDREDDGDDREPDYEAGNGEAPKGGGLASY